LDLYNGIGELPMIVALSAHITEEIRKKCFEIGFNQVLETPLTVKKVEDEIIGVIRRDRKIKRENLEILMR
jgi:CheY-like chemotaxis protein